MKESDWKQGLLWAEHLHTVGDFLGLKVPLKIILGYADGESWDRYIAEEITDRFEFIDGAHSYAEHVWQRLKVEEKSCE